MLPLTDVAAVKLVVAVAVAVGRLAAAVRDVSASAVLAPRVVRCDAVGGWRDARTALVALVCCASREIPAGRLAAPAAKVQLADGVFPERVFNTSASHSPCPAAGAAVTATPGTPRRCEVAL